MASKSESINSNGRLNSTGTSYKNLTESQIDCATGKCPPKKYKEY